MHDVDNIIIAYDDHLCLLLSSSHLDNTDEEDVIGNYHDKGISMRTTSVA